LFANTYRFLVFYPLKFSFMTAKSLTQVFCLASHIPIINISQRSQRTIPQLVYDSLFFFLFPFFASQQLVVTQHSFLKFQFLSDAPPKTKMRLFVTRYDVTKERYTRTHVGFSLKLQYFPPQCSVSSKHRKLITVRLRNKAEIYYS